MTSPAEPQKAQQPEQAAAADGGAAKKAAPGKTSGPIVTAPESRGKIYENITQTIGNTPLVRLSKLKAKYGFEGDILLKLEFFNPLASVKDRMAFAMIEEAERTGKITPGKTVIVEPTSGNTGIGLAFIAAYKGYRLILTMPESMSLERRKMLRLFGAELVLTPTESGMKGAIERADFLLKEHKDSFMPMQFKNPANPQIHSETTAEEIWVDTQGKVDCFVAGVGTGGTITGVATALKQKNAELKSYAVEPEESAVISGEDPGPHKIQGIGAGFIPDNYNEKAVDGVLKVNSNEAMEMAREIARLEGIPVGISSGANIAAALKLAQSDAGKGKTIVTISCSIAERYISTALFEGLDD